VQGKRQRRRGIPDPTLEKTVPERPAGVFHDLFSGYYDQDICFHTPNHFLPGLTDPPTLNDLRRLEMMTPLYLNGSTR
jgi:esterase/lipase superfamily enzyme